MALAHHSSHFLTRHYPRTEADRHESDELRLALVLTVLSLVGLYFEEPESGNYATGKNIAALTFDTCTRKLASLQRNKVALLADSSQHAEVLALKAGRPYFAKTCRCRLGKKTKNYRDAILQRAVLVTSLSPCAMCSELICKSGIQEVIIAMIDPDFPNTLEEVNEREGHPLQRITHVNHPFTDFLSQKAMTCGAMEAINTSEHIFRQAFTELLRMRARFAPNEALRAECLNELRRWR